MPPVSLRIVASRVGAHFGAHLNQCPPSEVANCSTSRLCQGRANTVKFATSRNASPSVASSLLTLCKQGVTGSIPVTSTKISNVCASSRGRWRKRKPHRICTQRAQSRRQLSTKAMPATSPHIFLFEGGRIKQRYWVTPWQGYVTKYVTKIGKVYSESNVSSNRTCPSQNHETLRQVMAGGSCGGAGRRSAGPSAANQIAGTL